MKNRKKWVGNILVLAILLLAMAMTGCGEEEAPPAEVYNNQAEANWVLLTIHYPEEAGMEDVVEYKVYSVNGTMTPLSTLQAYGEATQVPVVISEGTTAYVQGIGGIFENDYMAPSGWVYTVNDEMSMEAAGEYSLDPEDHVVWSYTTFTKEAFQ
jgi:hypothetical protein